VGSLSASITKWVRSAEKLQAILNFAADSYILGGVNSEISPSVFGKRMSHDP
jgi:hypothetical protein